MGVVDDDDGVSVDESGEDPQDTGAADAARRAVDENEIVGVRRLPGVPGRTTGERCYDDGGEGRAISSVVLERGVLAAGALEQARAPS